MQIMMIAGEASGDHYAGNLVEALRDSDPSARIWGMGGPAMRKAGAEIVQDIAGLDVMGFWDVLTRIGTFRRVFRELRGQMKARQPDGIVLVDYPGFNIRFAHAARQAGIPVIYFISPKVWAWKAGRIPKLAAWCRKMLVFFPFEVEVYKNSGLETICVGHPLARELQPFRRSRSRCRGELNLPGSGRLVGLLPGSRRREIKRMFPIMLDAAARLKADNPELVFAAGCAPNLNPDCLSSFLRPRHPEITIVRNKTHALMAAADALMITSGTATLEAGIIGTPHVLCYRVGLPTYLIVKPLLRTRDVGLVNIVSGRRIMPELIQFAMTPANIARETERFLNDAGAREQAEADLEIMFTGLCSGDTYQQAAEEIRAAILPGTGADE